MENLKLAVVGNESSILLFRSIGCDTFGVSNVEEAQKTTEKLFRTEQEGTEKTPLYAVIFVEENYFKDFSEDLLEKFTNKPLPAVVMIPSAGNAEKGFALARLKKIVERAVGSDILS
jgi:vacuolar-type H+-ATPase subunit F/Vma7